jgi:hypothetical protein
VQEALPLLKRRNSLINKLALDGTNLHHQKKGGLTMFAQPAKKHMICLVSAAIVLTLAGLFIADVAFARRGIVANTIDPVAIVTSKAIISL